MARGGAGRKADTFGPRHFLRKAIPTYDVKWVVGGHLAVSVAMELA